mmetsp:Transcript_28759/g.88159  ORF Transcript_28759/g.88159 Transcript_28759/m.88159 type:complete len:97 (-) Transcript_28759:464-754(-)
MHMRTTHSSHTAHSAVTRCSLTVPTLALQDSPGLAIDEELEHQDAMALDAARWSTKVCWPLAGQVGTDAHRAVPMRGVHIVIASHHTCCVTKHSLI